MIMRFARLIVALLCVVAPVLAHAQTYPGKLPALNVYGNPTGSEAPPTAFPIFSTANTWTALQTFNTGIAASNSGWACTVTTSPTTQCLNASQNSAGGTVSAPTNLNQVAITENLTGGPNFINGLGITQTTYGGNGGRQTVQIQSNVDGWLASGGNAFYATLVPVINAIANGSGAGALFAINPVAQITLGTYTELAVQENDISVASGQTAAFVDALKIVQLASHKVHGTTAEAAEVFTNQTGAAGWNVLIGLGAFNGGINPLSASGSILQALSAISTSGNGIDLSNMTFTGSGKAFLSTGFSVAGNGNVTATAVLTPAIVAASTQLQVGNGANTLMIGGSGMFTANGAVATTMTSLGPSGSHTTVQKWLTITEADGTTVGYIPVY